MPLHGKSKKSSRKKASKAAASPLMANEPNSSSSEQGSRRKREREERRSKREKRNADAKKSSSKSKRNSKPKLSRQERDAKDSQLGCWHKTQQILVKIVHVIDALIGLTFVVYGSLIINFENPAMDAVITSLAFGSTMLFTSIMGVIGFYSSMCSRGGLILSAYTSPFIALFYLLVIILLIGGPDKVFDYLREHKDVLYLNEAEILTLEQILPFFYVALASLAAIETIRFFVLRNLRTTLLRYDAANKRIHDSMVSSKSKRSSSKRSSSRRSGSNRSNLTEPLIGDEEEGEAGSEDY